MRWWDRGFLYPLSPCAILLRLKAYDSAVEVGFVAALWWRKGRSIGGAVVASWFDNNRPPDHDHNHVDTRKELIAYDPGLAALCREVFGDTKLTYTKPATRLQGHLEGYDPSEAPAFRWPERLLEAKAKIRREAELRSNLGKKSK